MIYIANDVGSKEFLAPLSKRIYCELANLEFGDFVFAGVGPDNTLIRIAVERKTWPDLVSSIESKRLQGRQAPGMAREYQRRYLLVEGTVRSGQGGVLEQAKRPRGGGKPYWEPLSRSNRGWTWPRVWGALFSLQEFGGLRMIFTRTQSETCDVLNALCRYWQKDYDEHDMFNVIAPEDSPQIPGAHLASLVPPTFFLKAMKEFKLLGYNRAVAVDKSFGSMLEACEADEKRWQEIPGIGKTMAKRIRRVLREGGSDVE